jgi:hypothetical protein
VSSNESLFFHFGLAPKKATEEINILLAETGAGLLIIDTMQKLARVKDLNDYAQVTAAIEPIHAAARQFNCHIALMHHAGKGERTDGDEVLGSTALLGAVDTCIIIKKRDERRTFSTIQRYGGNLPETLISLGSDFSLISEGTLTDAKRREIWQNIEVVLEDKPGLTEPEITETLSLRKGEVSATLQWARNQSKPLLEREGQGRKGNPFRYFLRILPPLPHYICTGELGKEHKSVVTNENIIDNSPPGRTHKTPSSGISTGGEFSSPEAIQESEIDLLGGQL